MVQTYNFCFDTILYHQILNRFLLIFSCSGKTFFIRTNQTTKSSKIFYLNHFYMENKHSFI
jgi:hypothetical protein